MMVGILLVLFNDSENLPRISRALKSQTYSNFRIYVIDNNPESPSYGIIQQEFPDARIIPTMGNTGFARGNNVLAWKAIEDQCDYLWVLNPDMEPEQDALFQLIQITSRYPAAKLLGPLLLDGNSKSNPKIQLFGSQVNFRTQNKKSLFSDSFLSQVTLPEFLKVDMINAGSIFISSEIVSKSYLFEESYFMYNDEIDIAKRITDMGYDVAVTSLAKVWHHHDWSKSNETGYNRMYYYMMRNKVLYFNKFRLKFRLASDILKQIILFPVVFRFCKKTSGSRLIYYYYLGYWHGILKRKGKADLTFS
jgi:O-antigen biosynthesis protein